MGHITFEPAHSADLDAITGLMARYYADDGYPFQAHAARDALAQLIDNSALGRVWSIRDESEYAGYLAVTFGFSLEYRGRDAFLDEVYIRPEWRGQGIGAQAVEVAVEACREAGVNAIHLEVERDKTGAIELYRRAGFRDGDRYLMTKWLTGPRA